MKFLVCASLFLSILGTIWTLVLLDMKWHNFMSYSKTAEMGWKGDLVTGERFACEEPVTIRESKQV